MTTVALVGGDGSGKTSIARLLEKSLPWPGRYLYMGTSVISSDVALPTSRLVRALKLRFRGRGGAPADTQGPLTDHLHYGEKKRGILWVAARFLNRMAEAWWRQLLSIIYRAQGNIVIFDRHFLFQCEDRNNSRVSRFFEHLERRIFEWFYPRPDLVIFLDAPPEVLTGRKGDATGELLEEQREAILGNRKMVRNFVVIDAGRPLEKVLEEVREKIIAFHATMGANGSLSRNTG